MLKFLANERENVSFSIHNKKHKHLICLLPITMQRKSIVE